MKLILRRFAPCSLVLLSALIATPQSHTYKLSGSISVGGDGGWDYLTADSPDRRLFVSHTGQVEVFDLDSQKRVGAITGLTRIHGIALAHEFGSGFISDGGANQIVQFDLKTLKISRKIPAGTNPDGIVYDRYSKQVFAFNGRSGDATVVSAESGAVAGTIKLGSKPEFPVSDEKGNIFVNMEDKNEIIKIDAKKRTILGHWPLTPCEAPSGLAIDRAGRRLFSVCDNKMMAVVDSSSGKVIATPVIGEGPDAAGYDPGTKLIFSSNGESGTLTVIREVDATHFTVAQNVETAQGARTMTLDEKTHRIFLPTASFGPAPAATASTPHPRPKILSNSFKLLVVTPS